MSTAGMNAGAGAGEAVDTRPKAGGTGTGGGADSKAVARRLQKELMQLMVRRAACRKSMSCDRPTRLSTRNSDAHRRVL